MDLKTEIYIRSLATMSRDEIGARMREGERLQGFRIITQAPWLNRDEWDDHTIISQDSRRIRLVALQAKEPGNGAFTRLIKQIMACGLIPIIVEPNHQLTDWCQRHHFRSRMIGRAAFKHEVWYPRKCAY